MINIVIPKFSNDIHCNTLYQNVLNKSFTVTLYTMYNYKHFIVRNMDCGTILATCMYRRTLRLQLHCWEIKLKGQGGANEKEDIIDRV